MYALPRRTIVELVFVVSALVMLDEIVATFEQLSVAVSVAWITLRHRVVFGIAIVTWSPSQTGVAVEIGVSNLPRALQLWRSG
jgi:hypothetical protein